MKKIAVLGEIKIAEIKEEENMFVVKNVSSHFTHVLENARYESEHAAMHAIGYLVPKPCRVFLKFIEISC